MKLFLSRKDNETKFELIQEQDGKCDVRFLNGSKKGETTTYTSGTIKRWWKEVEQKNISVSTNSSEKLENLKNSCSIKKPTKKIDRTEDVGKIVEMFTDDYVYKYYGTESCHCRNISTKKENCLLFAFFRRHRLIKNYFPQTGL